MEKNTICSRKGYSCCNINKTMKSYYDEERLCSQTCLELGDCYHLWTSERCEMIFYTEADFREGMNVIGICARLHPQIRILTFEIMSNHLHFALVGDESAIRHFFDSLKKYLSRHFRKRVDECPRSTDWSGFNASVRKIDTLEDLRNVIVYINRNGYVISKGHTPFTYPWGTNRYYFNPDAVALASLKSRPMTLRERQSAINSRVADHIEGLAIHENCALPLSFCDIASGERLFRNPSHYFYKLGRSIEGQKKIAGEISESIFYTDDELFSAISSIAREKYGCRQLVQVPAEAKLELARTMRFEYNSSAKQIQRMLKISTNTLNDILGEAVKE